MKTLLSILIAVLAMILVTTAALIKPAPGTAGDLTGPAPNTRKVLPNLVLSPALTEALRNAQNSLVSTIKKEARLIQRVPEQSQLALEDMYIEIDEDISIELSNVKLLSVPSIDIISTNPNLEFLNMALDIDFGPIEVAGNFEIFSKKTLAQISTAASGEFTLKNPGTKVTGKVGLSLQTGFFSTINYDLIYQPAGTYLTVSYLEENKRIVRDLEVQAQEAKIVAHINRQLKNVLNSMVKERLDEILKGMPLDKLIGEARAAESYGKHARALRIIANDYVDEILNAARSYIADKGLSQVSIPNIDASFSKTVMWVTWHGSFTTGDGHLLNLATIIRKGDFSVDYDTNTGRLNVFGSVGLSSLYLSYNKYWAEFMGVGPSGTLAANVGSNSIFLKVEVRMAIEPSIKLEDVYIEYLQNIEIKVTGLGILDWIASKITTWVVGIINGTIIFQINGQLQQYISEILPLVDPNHFFG